jgi:Mg-chelatase subunit ChlD
VPTGGRFATRQKVVSLPVTSRVADEGRVVIAAQLERTAYPQTLGLPVETCARISVEGIADPSLFPRTPAYVTFLVDISSSMAGPRLERVQAAVAGAIRALKPGDAFQVVSFSDSPNSVVPFMQVPAPSQRCPRPLAPAVRAVQRLEAQGGTNLLAAFQFAAVLARQSVIPTAVHRLLLLSDGCTEDEEAQGPLLVRAVAELSEEGVDTAVFGIGASFNEELLIALADAAHGTFHFARSSKQLASMLVETIREIHVVVSRQLRVELSARPGVAIDDVLGYPYRRLPGLSSVRVLVGDVAAGAAPSDILVTLSWTGGLARRSADSGGDVEILDVRVVYTTPSSCERVLSSVVQARVMPTDDSVPAETRLDRERNRVRAAPAVDVVVGKVKRVETANVIDQAIEAIVQQGSTIGLRLLQHQVAELLEMAESTGDTDLSSRLQGTATTVASLIEELTILSSLPTGSAELRQRLSLLVKQAKVDSRSMRKS